VYDCESLYLLEPEQVEEFRETTCSSADRRSMVVFSGYCSWGRGQLEREVQGDMWDLSHVFRSNVDILWDDLVNGEGEHLIPSQDLYERSDGE
jgi:putative AlgH/UPF0301 family transcriptional regulator